MIAAVPSSGLLCDIILRVKLDKIGDKIRQGFYRMLSVKLLIQCFHVLAPISSCKILPRIAACVRVRWIAVRVVEGPCSSENISERVSSNENQILKSLLNVLSTTVRKELMQAAILHFYVEPIGRANRTPMSRQVIELKKSVTFHASSARSSLQRASDSLARCIDLPNNWIANKSMGFQRSPFSATDLLEYYGAGRSCVWL